MGRDENGRVTNNGIEYGWRREERSQWRWKERTTKELKKKVR